MYIDSFALSSITLLIGRGLLLIWRIKAGLHQGMEIHLPGLTALILMFGRGLAIISILFVYVLLVLSGKTVWSGIDWNALPC